MTRKPQEEMMGNELMAYEDPQDPGNGSKYHSGKLCIEGCGRLAGTMWSPFWCFPCNVERMKRIGDALEIMRGPNEPQG